MLYTCHNNAEDAVVMARVESNCNSPRTTPTSDRKGVTSRRTKCRRRCEPKNGFKFPEWELSIRILNALEILGRPPLQKAVTSVQKASSKESKTSKCLPTGSRVASHPCFIPPPVSSLQRESSPPSQLLLLVGPNQFWGSVCGLDGCVQDDPPPIRTQKFSNDCCCDAAAADAPPFLAPFTVWRAQRGDIRKI